MSPTKAPQDHLTKKAKREADDEARRATGFNFTHGGETFTLLPLETIPTGWYRKNRQADVVDGLFKMLEELADEAALEAIDSMTQKQFLEFQDGFNEHNGANQGE